MDLLSAILLGIIQGLTEFLPISSTGHLILFANFLDIPSKLSFDAFIHLGSFLAIVVYFRKELREIWSHKKLIFLSALPGGIAGLSLGEVIESYFRTPEKVALMLILMTVPMFLGERLGKKELTIGALNPAKALFIGFAQALALLPGTSRSGITISAGLLVGLRREESAKYSFLAGAPLILGAGLYEGLKLLKEDTILPEISLAGFLSSTISSFLAILFLLKFLKTHTLTLFILYRLILGAIILALSLTGKI